MTKIWFDVQLLNSCQHSAGISKIISNLVNSVTVEEQHTKGSLSKLESWIYLNHCSPTAAYEL